MLGTYGYTLYSQIIFNLKEMIGGQYKLHKFHVFCEFAKLAIITVYRKIAV